VSVRGVGASSGSADSSAHGRDLQLELHLVERGAVAALRVVLVDGNNQLALVKATVKKVGVSVTDSSGIVSHHSSRSNVKGRSN